MCKYSSFTISTPVTCSTDPVRDVDDFLSVTPEIVDAVANVLCGYCFLNTATICTVNSFRSKGLNNEHILT
jgi:hypothetical protein